MFFDYSAFKHLLLELLHPATIVNDWQYLGSGQDQVQASIP